MREVAIRSIITNPPLHIPDCFDYRIVPRCFANAEIIGSYDFKPVIVWGETIKHIGDNEGLLEFIARVARDILPSTPGFDYYFVKNVAKQWSYCIYIFLSINTKERIIYELRRLEESKTPIFLWKSSRHLILNPVYLLKKIAKLIEKLSPYDFADTFYELYKFYQFSLENNIERFLNEELIEEHIDSIIDLLS